MIVLIYNIYPQVIIDILENINGTVSGAINMALKNENFDGKIVIDNKYTFDKSSNKEKNINDESAHVDKDLKIPYKYKNATYGDNYFIDDGADGTFGLTSSLCSKSCCAQQYPLPFDLPDDLLIRNSGVKYVSTNYTCNNGFQDTGCVCMTEEQLNFLSKRGNNI